MKHKGGTARNLLKEVWSELATRRTATGYRGRHGRTSGQEVADQSPYPSKAAAVNPAGVRGKLRGLPQEICAASYGTGVIERSPDRDAEVSRRRSVR